MRKKLEAFERLLNILDELREKCPWDKKQTLESLRILTIEETYELGDAIIQNDLQELKKELGDLMLHIVFYAKIADEKEAFDISDVLNSLCDKLVYRHPHVFGDEHANTAQEVLENWEALKLKEKERKQKRVLEGVPNSLPAMVKAYRIQDKARGVGFDWEKCEQVWDKIKEEFAEFETELKANNTRDMENEFGDMLFSMVNAARLYEIDPEAALERTNIKFIKRFNYLEEQTLMKGKSLHNMSLADMDIIWEEAKKLDNHLK